jgi:hypothetical protein
MMMTNQTKRIAPQNTISNPSAFFAERLQENSNLEMEWLWAAGEVTSPEEKRYCLLRALYINPDNRDTQGALEAMEREQHALEAIGRPRLSFRLWLHSGKARLA